MTQLSDESKAAINRARSLFCAAPSPFAGVACSDDQIVYLALTAWIAELDRERLMSMASEAEASYAAADN